MAGICLWNYMLYKVTSKFGFYRILNIPEQSHATNAAVWSHRKPHVVHDPTVVYTLAAKLVFLVGVEFLWGEEDFPGPPIHVFHGCFLFILWDVTGLKQLKEFIKKANINWHESVPSYQLSNKIFYFSYTLWFFIKNFPVQQNSTDSKGQDEFKKKLHNIV